MDKKSVNGLTQTFEESKSRIINSILIVFVIMSFPLLGISLSKTFSTGWNWVYFYNISAAMTAWVLFVFRKKIGTYYMAIVMCLVLITTACVGLYTAGILYHAKIFFIVAAIFTGLFIGRKQGYFLLGIISLILIAYAFLYLSGALQYSFDTQSYIDKPSIWITFSVTLIAVTLGLQIITNKYVDHFILSEKQIREKQELLKQSEERYRMLVETMNDGVGVVDLENKLTYVNPALCKMLGYSYDEAIGSSLENYLDDKNKEILRKQQELRRKGATKPYEIEWLGKNDTRVMTQLSPRAIFNDNGEYNGSFALVTDITARKKAEEQLKLTKFGIDHSNIGVFQIDDAGNLYYANEHACKSLGYTSEELLGLKIWDIDPNFDSEKWKVHRKRTRELVHSTIETAHKRKDGIVFPVEVAINFIEFKNKRYSISFAKDITERKQAEQSIRESEERYKRLAEATFEGIGISKDGKIIDVNDQICSIYGYEPEEFKQLGLAKLVHPDDREMVLNINRSNVTTPYTHRGIKKDGSLLYLEIHAGPIKVNNEDCRLTVIRDITEYKKAEQALMESEARYKVLVENSMFPVVVTTAESKVLFANKYAFDFFGGTEDKADEYDVKSFWNNPDDRENFIKELKAKGKVDNFEFEVKTASGIKTVSASTRIIEFSGQQAFYNIYRDITERKKALQALKESEEKYRIIAETSPNSITTTDLEGKITFASQRAVEMHGFDTQDEMTGRYGIDFISEEDRKQAATHLQYTLEKEIIRDIEYKCRKKDGKEFYAEFSASLLKNINNDPIGFLAITNDITDKKIAKQKLEERLLYEQIISEISTKFVNLPIERVDDEINKGFEYIGKKLNIDRIYLWEISENQKEYVVNYAWADDGIPETPVALDEGSFPYVKRKMLNKEVFKFTSIEEIPQTATYEAKHYKKYGIKSCIVIPLMIAENVIGCISFSTVRIKMEWREELIRFFHVIGHIISNALQRKNTELALRESEERFRLLIEKVPAVTWITSREGKTNYISPNVEQVYGYTPEEIYRKGIELWFKRIHHEDIDKVKAEFEQLFSGEKAYNIEYRIKRKDGNWIWLHDRANVFQEFDGVRYAYGVFSDITQQKNADLKIIESELQYRTLYENANDAIFLLKDFVFIDCNPKTMDLFRCESKDIIGRKPHELSPDSQPDGRDSEEKSGELMRAALSNVPQRFEWIHKRKDNSLFTAEVSLNTIELKSEKFLLALVRDITEIKEKHKEILRAVIKAEEKERNRIARDIHDGASPILSTIKLLSQSLAHCEDEKLQKKLLARIENAVREAITSLSEISIKLSPHILQNFGVVEAIRNFTKEISSLKNIKFNFKTSLKERLNENIEITIYRIVIELINNTLKYADAGKVDITLLKGKNISLTYNDDGKGFDVDNILKKKKGMGLHNLKTRVESVNGRYNIYSAPGKGVRLKIIIPHNE